MTATFPLCLGSQNPQQLPLAACFVCGFFFVAVIVTAAATYPLFLGCNLCQQLPPTTFFVCCFFFWLSP